MPTQGMNQWKARNQHVEAVRQMYADIIGASIADVVPVTASLRREFGWDDTLNTGIVMILDDGTALIPLSDTEGNAPGAIEIHDARRHRTHGTETPDDLINADSTFSLDVLVQVLIAAGLDGVVEQTGGGTATIYIGPTFTDEHGDTRYTLMAGPGWFDGPGWTLPAAHLGEFTFGPDDDGSTDPYSVDGPITYRDLAARIIEAHTRHRPDPVPTPAPARTPNSNVLEGVACPVCGQVDRFQVMASTLVDVTDEGTDVSDDATGVEWDETSFARCVACRYEGTWATFVTATDSSQEK